MRLALVNARVLCEEWLDGQAVLLEDGRIEGVVPQQDAACRGAEPVDLEGQLLLPGFIDVQVNGGGGVLFNDHPSVAAIAAIGAAHRRFGTTGFLPTLISDNLESIGEAIAATQTAIDLGVPGVLGLHIEGPFLNWRRRGVHEARHLRTVDADQIAALSRLRHGRTVLTLAPEMTSPDTIAMLRDSGIIPCAGHSEASFEETQAAIAHGVRGFTHLFNAMAPLTARAPGIAGAALYDPCTWCGIIVDGQHVAPAMLKLALRCKRRDRFMLITDAMPPVGAQEPTFQLQGKTIRVSEGRCVDAHGQLAGTVLDMASAVRNAVQLLGLDLAEAARMAARYPADFLGLGHEVGRIGRGYRADLVALDAQLRVTRTWIAGVEAQAL